MRERENFSHPAESLAGIRGVNFTRSKGISGLVSHCSTGVPGKPPAEVRQKRNIWKTPICLFRGHIWRVSLFRNAGNYRVAKCKRCGARDFVEAC